MGAGMEGAGPYLAHLDLTPAGNWGMDIMASRPSGERLSQRLAFNVTATPIVPAVGQAAPLSRSPTIREVPDAEAIDSGRPPDDMHQLRSEERRVGKEGGSRM